MKELTKIYYSYLKNKNLILFLGATHKGICYISTQKNTREEVKTISKYLGNVSLKKKRGSYATI